MACWRCDHSTKDVGFIFLSLSSLTRLRLSSSSCQTINVALEGRSSRRRKHDSPKQKGLQLRRQQALRAVSRGKLCLWFDHEVNHVFRDDLYTGIVRGSPQHSPPT